MLSKKERDGINSILCKLDNSTLLSIVQTTTQRLIKAETRYEAIKAILDYSDTAYSLLKRRKMKKEYLFIYLKENNIIISITSPKWKIIKECLKFWNSDTLQVEEIDDDCMDTEDEIGIALEVSSSSVASVHPFSNRNVQIGNLYENNSFNSIPQQMNSSHSFPQASNIVHSSNNLLDEMGRKFAMWFYGLLNQVNIKPDEFGPQHFWPDCFLKASIEQVNALINKNLTNAVNVSRYLVQLIISEGLYFQPNCYYGTFCETEVHGLVRIRVSGVIHKENNCVGLFDHVFGLVRSHSNEDNWKIKYIEMILKLKQTRLQICA